MANTGQGHQTQFGLHAVVIGFILLAGTALIAGLTSRRRKSSGSAGDVSTTGPMVGQVEGGI